MNLRQAAEALISHWEAGEYENCTGSMAGHIRVLRGAAAQPEWVGLTDDDIWEAFKQYDTMQYVAFSKAIEAKLREKNS